MSRVLPHFVLLFVVLAIVPGCQSKEEAIEDDLKQLGLAYKSMQIDKKETPSDWEDLITFAEENGLSADAIRRVRDAGYTVTWDLAIDLEEPWLTVMAQPPGEGRRLMADGGLER